MQAEHYQRLFESGLSEARSLSQYGMSFGGSRDQPRAAFCADWVAAGVALPGLGPDPIGAARGIFLSLLLSALLWLAMAAPIWAVLRG